MSNLSLANLVLLCLLSAACVVALTWLAGKLTFDSVDTALKRRRVRR